VLIFDLEFTDGKACRYLCPDPEATEQDERKSLEAIFCGRLKSMVRIIAPPPERLPWMRTSEGWSIGAFVLINKGVGSEKEFVLTWPGGILASKSKEEISAAVRLHWNSVV
jgi:hypothetical protein